MHVCFSPDETAGQHTRTVGISTHRFGTRDATCTAATHGRPDMPVHFSPEEMARRRERAAAVIRAAGLDGLLCFKQESMYWLTGYDSFGFSLFQCLIVGADGSVTLLTRLPDLRQARHTSNIEDIRIWKDTEGMNPARELRALLDELRLGDARLGVEFDSYGLKAHYWRLMEAELAGRCTLTDASTLIDRLRSVKSAQEIEYARRAAELADDAWDEAVRLGHPGAFEGDILAAMQGAVFRGGGDYAGNEFIIGSGAGALLCRYFSGRRHLDAEDQLTLEFAGAYRRYHAAMMRTLLTGRAHPEQVSMHAACVDAIHACMAAIRPGRPMGEVFTGARECHGRGGFARTPHERLRLRHGRGLQPTLGRSADVLRGQPSGDAARQRVLPAHDRDELGQRTRHDPRPLGARHR